MVQKGEREREQKTSVMLALYEAEQQLTRFHGHKTRLVLSVNPV